MRDHAGPPPDFEHTGAFPFLVVEGPGVYEIPVGPVHAGLIEPGHFRFSAVGETILRLKAGCGSSTGVSRNCSQGRDAGDAAATGGTSQRRHVAGMRWPQPGRRRRPRDRVPNEAHRLRALLIELERLYNHAADLGALANDVGFALANAHAQRIREQLLRLNAAVTGHRLLRGAIRPGAVVLRGLPDVAELRSIAGDLAEVASLTLANTVVHDRFAGTAVLTSEDARALGCLGYVARASGVRTDARLEHPITALPVIEAGATGGDVLSRYTVRRDEFAASAELAAHLSESHTGPTEYVVRIPPAREKLSGVGIVEGWRGTIVHRIEVDGTPGSRARLTRAKIVDPSWFNWPALPVAIADTIVPDFPLANKSFNQSYAGNDL